MAIFDAHCDVLYRLHKDPTLNFKDDPRLHITYKALKSSESKVQCFALFVPDTVPQEIKFQMVLEMIDIFHRDIIEAFDDMVFVQSANEIDHLEPHQIGAILTLEGCDTIGTDLVKLRTLFRNGVKSVGLTWNNANATADGAKESRGAGLSDFGREVVRENNKNRVWTDVSHLCERSFWDVMEEAEFPMASHSNARALLDHPRNLTDEQIRALFERQGIMGVTFVPAFLVEGKPANIKDILNHIEYLCELGGEKRIGFGSDFDGINHTPIRLQSYYEYTNLTNELLKNYREDIVKGFLYENFYNSFKFLG